MHIQKIKLIDGTADATTAIPGSANGLYVQGQAAADAAVAGNPLIIGGKALIWGAAVTPLSADGDAVPLLVQRNGLLYVATYHPASWSYHAHYAAAQTDLEVKAAGGAGLSHYITEIILSGVTAQTWVFEEGAVNVAGIFYTAANEVKPIPFRTPIKLTAATALTVTTTAAIAHSLIVCGFTQA